MTTRCRPSSRKELTATPWGGSEEWGQRAVLLREWKTDLGLGRDGVVENQNWTEVKVVKVDFINYCSGGKETV